jgi:hypothetical protein
MTLLRSILFLLALLAQSWPAQAMSRVDAPVACGMSCCASLAVAEISACGCAEPSAPAEPASVPPASGLERLPQVVWMSFEDVRPVTRPLMTQPKSHACLAEGELPCVLHGRLPVLFCSFLI